MSVPSATIDHSPNIGQEGPALVPSKDETHAAAEIAAAQAFRSEGFRVTNLNDIAGNFPAADLGAVHGDERLFVQVRGSSEASGDFPAPPVKARNLRALADAVGCHGIYCFVQFPCDEEKQVMRVETAARVAELAEATEAFHGCRTYLHVNIEDFDVTIDRISELLK
jgi:hypothetical protein